MPPFGFIGASAFTSRRVRGIARWTRALCGAMLVFVSATVVATAPADDHGGAALLHAKYAAARERLDHSPFDKPLVIESKQRERDVLGDTYAVVPHPFSLVRTQLRDVRNWCDILILHPNVRACRTTRGAAGDVISLEFGRIASTADFTFTVPTTTDDYFDVRLASDTGPLGTSDYRIRLEATPVDAQHTFLHFAFSHAFGTRARLAMKTYLGTVGREKVGFTVVDRGPDGRPVYVRDFRGALERNAMRYYLAIEAYLESLSAAPQDRAEKRLMTWYGFAERYPLQLREEPEFLQRKRREMSAQVVR